MENDKTPRPDRPRRRRKPAATRQQGTAPSAVPATRPAATTGPPRRRIHWARHGIEFLVIVAGIMVSFLLNEWRERARDMVEERQMLADLREDLRADSLTLDREIRDIAYIITGGERLSEHSEAPIPEDSITTLLSAVMSYAYFPSQDATFQAMRSTRSLSLLRDETLLKDILHLYGFRYTLIQEAILIDKHLVLERMLSVSDRNILLLDPEAGDLDRLMGDKEWRNLMEFSIVHKHRIRGEMQDLQTYLASLIARIDQRLGS